MKINKAAAALFLGSSAFLLPISLFAAGSVTINTNLPGPYSVATGGPVAIVANAYYLALALGGLLAFGSIVYAGIKWTASRGNASQISDAQDQITQAVIGLLILLGTYIILNTINPTLTLLNIPQLTEIKSEVAAGGGPAVPPTQEYSCFSGGNSGDTCYADSSCNGECASGETCKTDAECTALPPAPAPGACASGECVSIAGVVSFCKNGCKADSKMLNVLNCVNKAGFSLRITEAMPPTSAHKSHAHTDGCAVDSTLGPAGPVPTGGCAALPNLLSAISKCGGTPLNEYFSQCGGKNTEHSTGDHVHISACY